MNLPDIPTDNLYKFMAIFGLVLIVATNVIVFIAGNSIMNLGTSLLQSAAVSTYDQKAINEEKTNAQRLSDNLTKTLATTSSQQQQVLITQIAKEQDIVTNDNSKLIDVNNPILKFNESKELVKWVNLEEKLLLIFIGAGNAIGIVVAFYGFVLWYMKLQKYQDKMIKQKTESKN